MCSPANSTKVNPQAMLFATRNSISSCRPFAQRIGNTRATSRTRRRAFPRSPMLSAPYNSSPTAHSWKLDFCTPGEIFLSSGRRTAMASVFVIGRPFNSLRCIVCFSCGRSHFRRRNATSSSYFTLGKIPSRPLAIIYISHMIAEIGSLDNGVNFGEFNFRYAKRNAYFTSIKKKEKRKNSPNTFCGNKCETSVLVYGTESRSK